IPNTVPPPARFGGGELSFTVPEGGSLIARLTGALGNISEAFKRPAPLAAGATGDFTFLLKDESLASRIGREIGNAAADFQRDPKGFVVEAIKGEGVNKRRQRWILNAAAMAVIAYSLIFFVAPTLMILWFGNQRAVAKEEEAPLEKLTALAETPKIEVKLDKAPKSKLGGSKPQPKQASGGGGGGRQQPTPPSKGVPPQMALTPQIIMPNPEPPKIKAPTLVVASTVYGDPKAIPPQKGPIGDPLGVPAPPSSGPGKGAGIGTGEGTGVGRGGGGGVGAGQGGNVGGGNMGLGGGGSGIEEMGKNGVGRPTILYKEKAKYTEEARQNKVQGTVALSVVFTADGRITSIRVVRGLPDGLTEKAIEAAQRIRFQPATKNGAPVSVRGQLEFSFNLY
ncbi:MAG: energy transducer TonB, partial [Acidobacteria bacterium]|nr:energy transducer TonB [Acidobacteriota bacterium]